MKQKELTKVWGDTVSLTELFLSAVVGIAVTMGAYMLIGMVVEQSTEMPKEMVRGYALIAGIAGCFISGIITGRSFKPKREVIDGTEKMDLEVVLAEAGTNVQSEAEALSVESADVIREMEDLELYSLLSLIPEGTPNYKPEYAEYAKRGRK